MRLLGLALACVAICAAADSYTAAERRHWAFQPRRQVQPPGPGNPIDAFLKSTAPRADRRALLRRAYFDLTGLPPSPEDVDRFVNDRSSDAWPRVVDRLLASPAYAEQWARHWL